MNVADVAAYILDNSVSMTTMKLQKLVFYSQAESLCRTGKPLVDTQFYAWINGPVSRDLFNLHRGFFLIRRRDLKITDTVKEPSLEDKKIIDDVLNALGGLTGNQLSERTHNEDPWKNARQGLAPDQIGTEPITQEAIRSYYLKNPVLR